MSVAVADFYPIRTGTPLPNVNADQVGNKAWHLIQMTASGLPVPAAFVLPTAWYQRLRQGPGDSALERALDSGITMIERASGLRFGSPRRPLLVSVRSGSAVSMPGMMETVLNVGLNSETVHGLIGMTGNPRLAWDSYRRFVQNYAEVACGLDRQALEELQKEARPVDDAECEPDFRELRDRVRRMLRKFEDLAGMPFPEDPKDQLKQSALAVFRSWDAPKAAAYRQVNGIDETAGTAATIQMMVFGNAGGASGSGVAFTRNPSTGEPQLYLDFQFNVQGEDIVGGQKAIGDSGRLSQALPEVWSQLRATGRTLEALFRDAQDFEFTLQRGTLYLLQSRSAKRTPWAALRIAVDLVEEGLIESSEGLARLSGIDIASVVRTHLINPGTLPLARAAAASLGCAAGVIALDSTAAERLTKEGTSVILVRKETVTEDIGGMLCAAGILTATGGRTSHAAVIARQLGKVCLVGCPSLDIDLHRRLCRIGEHLFHEGEFISLDGNDGGVYSGKLETVADRPERELARIEQWRAKCESAVGASRSSAPPFSANE